jgi:regulator of protease activity HflC (stomatin/prohibitin superfamily)
MDILHLVDRLEELINQSRSIPFTHNVIVDEDRMLDLIDQMRVAIPEEVKKSLQVLSQKDRVMAQAKEEAERTLSIAKEKSDKLADRDSIVQDARKKASQIEAEAEIKAQKTQAEADEYVTETLTNLEIALERVLNQVRNGIYILEEEVKAQEDPAEDPEA